MAENRKDSTISPKLITALDRTWGAIQRRHPEVPAVVITLGQGFTGKTAKYGHFADSRWQLGDNRVPEMFMGAEGLQRGARGTLGTLIHEAAHGVASVRGVQDTSRQGRFHNRRFKGIAEEMGLSIAQAPGTGWSSTTVPDGTAVLYKAEMRLLEAALVGFRHPEPRGGRRSSNNPLPMICGCGRRIRVAPRVIEAGPIGCGVCGQPFEVVA
jgi:hypothetical protein